MTAIAIRGDCEVCKFPVDDMHNWKLERKDGIYTGHYHCLEKIDHALEHGLIKWVKQ